MSGIIYFGDAAVCLNLFDTILKESLTDAWTHECDSFGIWDACVLLYRLFNLVFPEIKIIGYDRLNELGGV